MQLVGLIVVGVAACHHFGWEGIGIVAAVWLLMPYDTDKDDD